MNTVAAPEILIRVSARSRPAAVAGAIAGQVRDRGESAVQAIGAGAVNQAIKAVALARLYLVEDGIDIACVPSFSVATIDDRETTALRLAVRPR